jgi:acyl-CoA thioester hydrolase
VNQRPLPPRRGEFAHFQRIATRWMDNDAYGHVNNVVYYAYFDTVVNEHLVRDGGLDIERSPAIGVVVETGCRFFRGLAFPEPIDAGMRVERLGRSSVEYAIALFGAGDDEAAAAGRFVHVWVDRTGRRPVAIPERVRAALERLRAAPHG